MLESILFKQIQMVLPEHTVVGDLLVENGKITKIAPQLPEHAELVIKDSGLTLMPGVIDPHVHFRDPGAPQKETLESGSIAAVAGGVTSFLDMPNTNPATVTCDLLAQKYQKASETSLANFGFFIGATTDNLDELCKAELAAGIKVFMGSSTGNLLVDKKEQLEGIFSQVSKLIAVHAEDEAMVLANKERFAGSTDVHDHNRVRTPEAAIKATQLAVQLANTYKKRLHICHLTTQEEAEWLATHKTQWVSTEVSPQHLLLQAPEIYDRWGTFAQINPPIRDKRHREALAKALLNGVIDCVATDHAPHTVEDKQQPFPKAHSGMPGVETSLPLLLNQMNQGFCTLEQVVRWMCEAPARVYGIQNKGKLAVGYDADLVLVDLNAARMVESKKMKTKVGWSVFEGQTLKGWPVMTFVNGQLVFREGDVFGDIKGKALTFSTASI